MQDLPPEPMKFALNASLNTLPTNANLHTWGKKPTDVCPLCQTTRQTLVHVLNNCPSAMELRRYSLRHHSVLQVFGDFIKSHLAPHFSISIDSPLKIYSFPHHITPTNLRPGGVTCRESCGFLSSLLASSRKWQMPEHGREPSIMIW